MVPGEPHGAHSNTVVTNSVQQLASYSGPTASKQKIMY